MKIGNVAKVQGGYAFKSSEFISERIPIIRIGNLDGEKVIVDTEVCYTENFWEDHPEFRINIGDILVAMSGATVGKIGVYESTKKALFNQRVGNILPTNNINKEYLYYYCMSPAFKRNIEKKAFGCAQPNISSKQIEDFDINIPSIEEQEKAVNVFGKTYCIIKCRKKQLKEFNNLIKSRFVELFGDTVTNSLGWKEHRLDEYIEFLTSGSRGWAQYFVDNKNELFITIKNVKNNHITLDDIQYIDAPNNKEAERTKVKTGDLLISITADLGRTGVVGEDIAATGAYINQHLSLVRLNKEKVNPLFVSYFLETEGGKRQFESKNQNGVKAGLNFDAIKSLRILVPPMDKQEEYLDFVKQVDKLKVKVQKSLEETQMLFDSFMQEYFG